MAQVLNLSPPHRILCCTSSIHLDSSIRPNLYPDKWTSLHQKLKCRGRHSCLFSDNRRELLDLWFRALYHVVEPNFYIEMNTVGKLRAPDNKFAALTKLRDCLDASSIRIILAAGFIPRNGGYIAMNCASRNALIAPDMENFKDKLCSPFGDEQARKALESALGGKKNEFEKWNKEIQKREALDAGGNAGGGGWFGWGRWFSGSNGDNFWQEAQQSGLAILGIFFMYLVIAKGEVMLAVILNPLLFALRGTRNGFTFISSRILRKISPTSPYIEPNMTLKNEFHTHVSAKENVMRKWGSD